MADAAAVVGQIGVSPNDPHTADRAARGRDRIRRVYITALTSLLARFGSIAVLLVTVPLALSHLGPERFGMWMVISSLGAVMAFADFGIGNGVLNIVSSASGVEDRDAALRASSSGMVLLSTIAAVVVTVMVVSYPLVRWEAVFQVSGPLAVEEAGQSILAFVLCFAIGVPAGLASKIQLGLQRGYAVNFWIGLGGVLSLVGVVSAILLDAGTPVLVLALFGSQQLALVLNSIYFFVIQRRDLAPRWSAVSPKVMTAILGLGSSFFLLQLVSLIAFRIDTLIVTQLFGPEAAGSYAVVDRLFMLITMVASVFLAPLWPAYGEAISRGDGAWVRATLRHSFLIAVGGAILAGVAIILFHRLLLDLWIGSLVALPLALLSGFAVFKVFETAGNTISMFLNGAGYIRAQVVLAVLMASAATALKLAFGAGLGLASIMWFTALSYLAISLVPAAFLARRLLTRIEPR